MFNDSITKSPKHYLWKRYNIHWICKKVRYIEKLKNLKETK